MNDNRVISCESARERGATREAMQQNPMDKNKRNTIPIEPLNGNRYGGQEKRIEKSLTAFV